MKVRLLRHELVDHYISVDPLKRSEFGSWVARVRHARVMKPVDMIRNIGPGTYLKDRTHRIVYSIKNFRVICLCIFDRKRVYLMVLWIGTLLEYNKLTDDDRRRIISLF